MDRGAWWAALHGVAQSSTRLSDFIFTFHFHALEKETATHSRILVWRIPGTGEPSGMPSMGLHRVGHDWRDLAAAAAFVKLCMNVEPIAIKKLSKHEYVFQLNRHILDLELNIESVFQQTICRRLWVPVCLGRSDDRRFCRMSHLVGLIQWHSRPPGVTLPPRGVPAGLQSTPAAWRTDSEHSCLAQRAAESKSP